MTAKCRDCNKVYSVGMHLAGKKFRCKACGGVIVVPAASTAPIQSGDPFENVDALMALERAESAAAAETASAADAPAMRPRARARTATTARATALPRGGVAAAPTRAAAKLHMDAPAPSNSNVAGNTWIERLLIWASFGAFVAAILVPVVAGTGVIVGAEGKVRWERVQRDAGYWAVWVATYAVLIFGVCGGLALVGVRLAARMMKFQPPPRAYWRATAAFCAPLSVQLILVGLWFGTDWSAFSPPAQFHWSLMLLVLIAVLWLLFRLRLARFAVTAGLVVLFAAVLPWLAYWGFVLASGRRVVAVGGRLGLGWHIAVHKSAEQDRRVAQLSKEPAKPSGARGNLPDESEHHARVEESFKRVSAALTAYATGHGGSYPWDPIELASAKLIQFSDLGTPGRLPYRYEGRDLKVPLPADLIVMYEEGVRDRKRTVLFGDGRVETIDIGNWEKMLDDSHKLWRKVRGRR